MVHPVSPIALTYSSSHPTLVPEVNMRIAPSYSVADRRDAKRVSRERDVARLRDGSVQVAELSARNGFFSVLDRSKAQIVERRARVNIERD